MQEKIMRINVSSLQTAKQAGFTLLEILVVMVILGIILALSAGSYISSQQKSRDSRRKSDLKQIGIALEAYYNDKGAYPSNDSNFRMMGCLDEQSCSWGSAFEDDMGTVYMVEIPADPRSNLYYHYESNGVSYQLYARLENTRDRDIPKDSEDNPQVYDGVTCGDYDCNYGVSSSNTTPEEGKTLVTE
jgi:general secretion pathway protein G